MSKKNRLRAPTSRQDQRSMVVKADKTFATVVDSLLDKGYANFSEVCYDAVYRLAKQVSPSLPVATLEAAALTSEEEEVELERLGTSLRLAVNTARSQLFQVEAV